MYLAELEANQDAWLPLISKIQSATVTLLTAEKDPENQHAGILKAFLIQKAHK